MSESLRLNHFLAKSGYCSRREADRLIEMGEVRVNGQEAVLGLKVGPDDLVEIDGRRITQDSAPAPLYLALHKPRGIVCTTDRREKDNIVDYLAFTERIFPIGRLDKDSSGLILLTNDGSIVNRLLRAQYGHEKEYRVVVDRALTMDFIRQMEAGVPILDTVTKEAKIKQIGDCEFRIVLTQGLNRQIRRMCEYLGYRVLFLQRVRILHITLGQLRVGEYRELRYRELEELESLLRAAEARLEQKKTEQGKMEQGK